MSDEEQQVPIKDGEEEEQQQQQEEDTEGGADETIRTANPRPRGRPKGSKNKPKQEDDDVGAADATTGVAAAGGAAGAGGASSGGGPKRRGKRQTAPLVWSGDVPKDDCAKLATGLTEGVDVSAAWPHGWKKETYGRPSTNSKTTDSYWYTPEKNYKLRSLPDVQRFLEALVGPSQGDETLALQATNQYGRTPNSGGSGGKRKPAGGGASDADPSNTDEGDEVTAADGTTVTGGGGKKRAKKEYNIIGNIIINNNNNNGGSGGTAEIKVKQRRTKSGKKDKNAPKGPMSAYVYFAADRRPQILMENPDIDPFKGVGSQLGAEWKELDSTKKKEYELKAAEDRARYATELEAYKETLRNNAALAAAVGTAMMTVDDGGDAAMASSSAAAAAAGMIATMTPDGEVVAAAPIKTTTVSKRGARRKDPNAPKRALGAYNYFVRLQNKLILQVVQAENPFDPEINDPNSLDYVSPELLQKLKIADGKVNFHEVGRLVGQRWRAITNETRAPYDEMAAQDVGRYKREMEAYDPEKSAAALLSSDGGGNIVLGEDGLPLHPHDRKRIRLGARAKKAKDAPKQALSAYNYFFQAERDRVAKVVVDPTNIELNNPSDPDSYITPDQLATLHVDGKQTTEVGKYIGQRWKAMKNDISKRSIYDAMANDDMGRFNRELEAYKAKKELERGPSSIDATATAAAAAAAAMGHHHHHHHMAVGGGGASSMNVDEFTSTPNVAALAAAAAASMQQPGTVDDAEDANGIVAAAAAAVAQAHAHVHEFPQAADV